MKLTIFGCTLIAALLLSSCEKSMEVAGAAEGNSKLTVQTQRSPAADRAEKTAARGPPLALFRQRLQKPPALLIILLFCTL